MVESVGKHYDILIEKHGPTLEALEWGSKESQIIRFKILCEIGDLEGKSILDVGCGLGHLYDYLKSQGFNVNYKGIDISPKMISEALKRNKELNVIQSDIRDISNIPEKHDYVLASGILTSVESTDDIKTTIRNMFTLCKIGAAFNIVSVFSPSFEKKINANKIFYKYQDRFWTSPPELLKLCMGITPFVVLRHNYRINDVTLMLYRNSQ